MADRARYALTEEAVRLVTDGSGRWEHVALWDGDAAQAMVPGVRAMPSSAYVPAPEPGADLPDPNQMDMLDD